MPFRDATGTARSENLEGMKGSRLNPIEKQRNRGGQLYLCFSLESGFKGSADSTRVRLALYRYPPETSQRKAILNFPQTA